MGLPLVSGLTIVRNGVRLDYPFVEVIRSGLPVCDEYLVVVGDSDDGTREAVESIGDPKIRIIDTVWSPYVEPRKCLLAQQTSLGLHLCSGRWCLYLQGNEVLHESSLPKLRSLMEEHAENRELEAFLLERLTFWADEAHYFKIYPERFKYTVRIIRPHIGAYSIRDAMSFAVFDRYSTRGRYPRSMDTGEDLYRYGKIGSVAKLGEKLRDAVHKDERKEAAGDELAGDHYFTRYPAQFFGLFAGTHPAVMQARLAAMPARYDLADARCRRRMTFGERRRVWETRWYSRYGFPKWRDRRYRLVGDYAPKPRPGV